MDNLFLPLFLASFVCLIVGLVKPTVFSRFIKGEITRKKIGLIFGIVTVVFFVLFGAKTNTGSEKKTSQNSSTTQTESKQPTPEEQVEKTEVETKTQEETQEPKSEPSKAEEKIPKYQIAYELSDKRYDGGKNYYVLIDPIDLSNDSFKNDMKIIVKKIVAEKGNKISVDILDDKNTLDLFYKSHYGTNQLGRILNQTEVNQVGDHLIAAYSGELNTGLYLNTLDFFPGTFKDNPKVGMYIESMEYNAKN